MSTIATAVGTKRPWSRSARSKLGIAALILALAGALGWRYRGSGEVQYYTAQVERGSISQVVQATGTINAVVSVQVGSQVSGTIQKIFVDFNSHVKQGQVIAQIDPSIFKAKLDQANADLATAQANLKALEAQIEMEKGDVAASQANLEKARAQLFDAKTQADRTQQLAETGVVAAQQRDTAVASYQAAKAGVDAAEAAVEQSKAKLQATIAQRDQAVAQVQLKKAAAESAKLDLDHTTIYAPIEGTVIARNVDVGQTVAASLQAPTLFVIAQDLTKMLVYAKTDEADVGRIRPGAEATFRVDAFPRETFSGRVQQVRMNATTVQNVVTYDTIIEFDNPGQRLFPGMTAYVSIPVASAQDVIKIPNGALRFNPEISDSERAALFAKYNVLPGGAAKAADDPAQTPAADSAAPNSQQETEPGTAQGNRAAARGGRRGAGFGGGPRANTASAGAGSARNDFGIVWKLLPDKSLQPVRVRLGVTDYTFTEMQQGDLKPGDELVIGQASANSNAANQPAQRPPLGPGAGPGGGFRGRF